jgi:GNAT superfamily N-acetyltransferase
VTGRPAGPGAASEANGAEFLLAMGRAGGGSERDDARVQWTIGGSPIDYHNCVVRADVPASEADGLVRASLAELRARGVPGTWHVGPSMRPADIGERLLRHGFAAAGEEIGMAVDLDALPGPVAAPADLAILRVRDERALATWVDTLGRGFGEGEREARWVGDTYARIGLGDDVPWRHHLGVLAGEPVATASLFLGAGAAGIYFVFTVAEARRRGIGAALTLNALVEARALGHRKGVLQSSAMGEAVYRRLGFREECRVAVYEWSAGGPS